MNGRGAGMNQRGTQAFGLPGPTGRFSIFVRKYFHKVPWPCQVAKSRRQRQARLKRNWARRFCGWMLTFGCCLPWTGNSYVNEMIMQNIKHICCDWHSHHGSWQSQFGNVQWPKGKAAQKWNFLSREVKKETAALYVNQLDHVHSQIWVEIWCRI